MSLAWYQYSTHVVVGSIISNLLAIKKQGAYRSEGGERVTVS